MKTDDSKSGDIYPSRLVAITNAHIAKTTTDGAILVFLPGFREFQYLSKMLVEDNLLGVDLANSSKYRFYLLHSAMTEDHASVFLPTPDRVRKLVLSTNTEAFVYYLILAISKYPNKSKPYKIMRAAGKAYLPSDSINWEKGKDKPRLIANTFIFRIDEKRRKTLRPISRITPLMVAPFSGPLGPIRVGGSPEVPYHSVPWTTG